MKHLIIYSHLNPKSFTKAIVDKVESVLVKQGTEVQVIDLMADKFNPILSMPDIEYMYMGKDSPKDVKKYQDLISWADKLTVVYPLWWGQMPAQLKGFFDRVLTNGFAFEYTQNGPKGLLENKTAQLIINIGSPSEVYEKSGMFDAINKINETGTFAFCGIKAQSTYFGSVNTCSDEQRKSYLKSIEKLY